MKFELFLNAAAKRNDLSFISMGLSTCDGELLASKDRRLYTFGLAGCTAEYTVGQFISHGLEI